MAIKVVFLCSGYDSQALSLERLKRDYSGFDYELVAWAEFDPDSKQPIEKQSAVIAHNALFPEWSDRNLGDITNADWGIIKGDIDIYYVTRRLVRVFLRRVYSTDLGRAVVLAVVLFGVYWMLFAY